MSNVSSVSMSTLLKKTVLVIGIASGPLIHSRMQMYASKGIRTIVLDLNPNTAMAMNHPSIIYISLPLRRHWWQCPNSLKIFYYLLKYRPDWVHVHWLIHGLATLPLLVSRKLIVTGMGWDIDPNIACRGLNCFWAFLLCLRANKVTVKSEDMSSRLQKILRVPKAKISIIRWGVPREYFENHNTDSIRNHLGIPKEVKLFFCARAMQPLYRKIEILRAFIQFKRKTQSLTHLMLVCHRPESNYMGQVLLEAKQSFCSKDIHILPNIPSNEMPRYLHTSDVVISFPTSEGLSQTLLETMASGKYSILPRLSAYEKVVRHPKNAYLADSEKNLVEAMEYAEKQDPITYAEENRHIIREQYSHESEMLKLFALAQEITEASSSETRR